MKLESYSVMKKYVIRLSLKYFVDVISTILQAFLSTGVCIFLLLYLSSHLALCLILYTCNAALWSKPSPGDLIFPGRICFSIHIIMVAVVLKLFLISSASG